METKIVRFNLSGNWIFREEMIPKVSLIDTGSCLNDYHSEDEEKAAEKNNYEYPTTLRDISILLYECCGQGVGWQLSRELSSRLNIDKKDVQIALLDIIKKYSEMNEDDASKKWWEDKLYIKTEDDAPEED